MTGNWQLMTNNWQPMTDNWQLTTDEWQPEPLFKFLGLTSDSLCWINLTLMCTDLINASSLSILTVEPVQIHTIGSQVLMVVFPWLSLTSTVNTARIARVCEFSCWNFFLLRNSNSAANMFHTKYLGCCIYTTGNI